MNQNCTCPKTDFRTENVIELKPHPFLTELHNASFFNQIHKRTTHSREAFVALLCIGGLTSLVIVSVFLSKMWREKSTFAVQQKQHEPKDEILVRGNSIYDHLFSRLYLLFLYLYRVQNKTGRISVKSRCHFLS